MVTHLILVFAAKKSTLGVEKRQNDSTYCRFSLKVHSADQQVHTAASLEPSSMFPVQAPPLRQCTSAVLEMSAQNQPQWC